MKFTVTMKDPDTLHDCIRDAVRDDVEKLESLSAEEKEALVETRIEDAAQVASKWFEYGEYLRVEIDTKALTCTVLTK